MNLDELLKQPPRPTKHCQFAAWLTTLKQDDIDAIWRAFDNDEIQTRHIYRTLKSIGCPNRESSIRSHRRGDCIACERNRNGLNV